MKSRASDDKGAIGTLRRLDISELAAIVAGNGGAGQQQRDADAMVEASILAGAGEATAGAAAATAPAPESKAPAAEPKPAGDGVVVKDLGGKLVVEAKFNDKPVALWEKKGVLYDSNAKPAGSPNEAKPSGGEKPADMKPSDGEKPADTKVRSFSDANKAVVKNGSENPLETKARSFSDPGPGKTAVQAGGEKSKPVESKPAVSKPGESKPGESKPSEKKASTSVDINLKAVGWGKEAGIGGEAGAFKGRLVGEVKATGVAGVGYTDGKYGAKAEGELQVGGKAEGEVKLWKGGTLQGELSGAAKVAGGAALLVGAGGVTAKLKVGAEAEARAQAAVIHDTGGMKVGAGVDAKALAKAEIGAAAEISAKQVKVTYGAEVGASVGIEGTAKFKDKGAENSFNIGGGVYAGAKAGGKVAIDTDALGNPTVKMYVKIAALGGAGVSIEAKLDTKAAREAIKSIDKDMSDKNSKLAKALEQKSSVEKRGLIWQATGERMGQNAKTGTEKVIWKTAGVAVSGVGHAVEFGGKAGKAAGELGSKAGKATLEFGSKTGKAVGDGAKKLWNKIF
jgi:hypothetical protein